MTRIASPSCPMCARQIRELLDVPSVSVDRVQCFRPLQAPRVAPPESSGDGRGPRRKGTRIERSVQDELRRERKEDEQRYSKAKEVAAGDSVRRYLAHLRSMSGKTVASSALLPPWQVGTESRPAIPDTPTERYGRWAVWVHARWEESGLAGKVDVELVYQGREFGQHVGLLAHVWLRGHWNPCA